MAYNPNNPNGQATSANSAPVVIASDQSPLFAVGTINANPPQIYANPTANTMAALNATVQYQVEANASYLMTLTNAAAATTAWVGTVTFQYSTNGSSWTSLNAQPLSTPTAQVTTTSTANGLWIVEAPASTSATVYIRALMSAYTSGTAVFQAATWGQPNTSIALPWVYSVTSGATLVGPIDAAGIGEISIQISAITTTVLTAQGTNDPSLTTWDTIPVQDNKLQGGGALTLTAASTYRFQPAGFKYVRIQVTTTGTVLTVQGVYAKFGQNIAVNGYGNAIAISNTPAVTVSSGTVTTVSTVTSVTAVAAINSVATTNGLSIGTVVTAATPATNSIKATAGRLMHISVGNPNAAAVYLKIFNVAAPTLGTTSANMNYLIPATSQTTIPINDVGLFFSTAIVTAVTGGISLTDNTSITAGCAVSYSWI